MKPTLNVIRQELDRKFFAALLSGIPLTRKLDMIGRRLNRAWRR